MKQAIFAALMLVASTASAIEFQLVYTGQYEAQIPGPPIQCDSQLALCLQDHVESPLGGKAFYEATFPDAGDREFQVPINLPFENDFHERILVSWEVLGSEVLYGKLRQFMLVCQQGMVIGWDGQWVPDPQDQNFCYVPSFYEIPPADFVPGIISQYWWSTSIEEVPPPPMSVIWIRLKLSDSGLIFADGFESGDTAVWQ